MLRQKRWSAPSPRKPAWMTEKAAMFIGQAPCNAQVRIVHQTTSARGEVQPIHQATRIGVEFSHELTTRRAGQRQETIMLDRFSGSMIAVAVAAAAASLVISAHGQSPAASAPAPVLKTSWGEPDLQGIWMEETDTPLQRPAKYADQEFFTPEQRAELDAQRAALEGKDERAERGTELDVGGSYNQLFVPRKHTGSRTSMIVDPPNGRIPQMTAEAQKLAAAARA